MTVDARERLANIDTATIHEAQGRLGALDPAIKPAWPGPRTAGRAFTVRCHPGDNLAIHRAVAVAEAGDMLVVDAGRHLAGYWGEVLAVAAQARGIAGLVIDGGCRDVEAVAKLGFGVWSRGVSIVGCVKSTPGWIAEPIACGGIVVRTGDFIVADGDGVVAVAAELVKVTAAAADARITKEQGMMERLRAGELTLDLFGLREALARHGVDDGV